MPTIFSKPIRPCVRIEEEDGIKLAQCSNPLCTVKRNVVFMECCSECLDVFCSASCCFGDVYHVSRCLHR